MILAPRRDTTHVSSLYARKRVKRGRTWSVNVVSTNPQVSARIYTHHDGARERETEERERTIRDGKKRGQHRVAVEEERVFRVGRRSSPDELHFVAERQEVVVEEDHEAGGLTGFVHQSRALRGTSSFEDGDGELTTHVPRRREFVKDMVWEREEVHGGGYRRVGILKGNVNGRTTCRRVRRTVVASAAAARARRGGRRRGSGKRRNGQQKREAASSWTGPAPTKDKTEKSGGRDGQEQAPVAERDG